VRDLPLAAAAHDTNRGKAASLRSAFAHALRHDAECAITLDGDGQHDPADLPGCSPPGARTGRLVIGSRLHDRRAVSAEPRVRQPLRLLLDLLGRRTHDRRFAIGLRVYPRAVMALALTGGAAATASPSRARS
jgi:hypothetical protein